MCTFLKPGQLFYDVIKRRTVVPGRLHFSSVAEDTNAGTREPASSRETLLLSALSTLLDAGRLKRR